VEERNIILERNMDIGDGWFEAPSNVSYAIIGLLWGEGDFKKTMILAINCGDDTDCTAATVGATMGILGGSAAIPEDWKQHIGDEIVTISINKGNVGRRVPTTCTELSERVIRQTPHVLFANDAPVELVAGPDSIPENVVQVFKSNLDYAAILDTVTPNTTVFESAMMTAIVTLEDGPDIVPMGEKSVHIKIKNNRNVYDNALYNLELRWWLPEGFSVEGCRRSVLLPHFNSHQKASCDLDLTIKAGERVEASNRCVLEVTAKGRPTALYVPILLLG
jgi:hypothetical protein